MAAPAATERLRITPRSAVTAVALFGFTLALLGMVTASRRVLGWMVAAATIAGILHPLVTRVARRLPRGLAVAVVVLTTLVTVGLAAYRVVDDIRDQTDRLRTSAPAAARRLERDDGRLAELAREAKLAERTQRFVDDVPERLRGGTPAQALRSAATRGVAYLATGILSIFFLLHGPKLAAGASRQIRNPATRARLERVAGAAFTRGFGYARGTLGMAMLAGGAGYGVASAADIPGAAPLGLWMALWDVVPYFGALIGALPIVILGGIGDPERGIILAVVFLVYEALETFLAQRRLERSTVRVGPFLTTVGAFAGLELYGLGGAVLAIVAVALTVAALDEVAPA